MSDAAMYGCAIRNGAETVGLEPTPEYCSEFGSESVLTHQGS